MFLEATKIRGFFCTLQSVKKPTFTFLKKSESVWAFDTDWFLEVHWKKILEIFLHTHCLPNCEANKHFDIYAFFLPNVNASRCKCTHTQLPKRLAFFRRHFLYIVHLRFINQFKKEMNYLSCTLSTSDPLWLNTELCPNCQILGFFFPPRSFTPPSAPTFHAGMD